MAAENKEHHPILKGQIELWHRTAKYRYSWERRATILPVVAEVWFVLLWIPKNLLVLKKGGKDWRDKNKSVERWNRVKIIIYLQVSVEVKGITSVVCHQAQEELIFRTKSTDM